MPTPSLTWLLPRARSPLDATDPTSQLAGLTPHELAALASEGLVVAAAGGFLASDAAVCPPVRAHALARELLAGEVVGGAAALWVRGAVGTCGVVDVVVTRGRTGGSRRDPPWRLTRTATLAPGEVELVHGVAVTSLARTAADIAVWYSPARAAPLLRTVASLGEDADGALASLAWGATRPGQRRARHRLRALLPAPRAGSVAAAAGEPVDVEDAVHPPHRPQHVPEVGGVGHLEGEA